MELKSNLIFLLILMNNVVTNYGIQYEGDVCQIDSSTTGICRYFNQCPILQVQLSSMQKRPVICGFDQRQPIVCCPGSKQNLLNSGKKTTKVGDKAKQKCKEYSVCILGAFGGVDANFGEFKSMAAIGWPSVNGDYAWKCGGTLISVNYVLTAGHCTISTDTQIRTENPTVVRIGSVNLKKSTNYEKTISIIEIILHPEYRAPFRYNDIALLKLADEVGTTIAHRPGCLTLDDSFSTTVFEAVGWGKTGTSESSDVLQKVILNIVDNPSCEAGYKGRRTVPNGIIKSQLCAGANGTQDTCPGDSGGPLLFHNDCGEHIIGITSFGIGCGGIKVPGVYTRVSSYVDWIENIVWD